MSVPKKILDKLPEGFADAIEGSAVEEIRKRVLEAENHLFEIEQEKDKDENLKRAKEELKLISSAYNEAKKVSNAKIKFCMHIAEGRGVKI